MPDGALLEGTVDVVYEHAGGLTILDFKTDREPSTLADSKTTAPPLLPGVRGTSGKAGAGSAGADLTVDS
jgi:hypothetical protein